MNYRSFAIAVVGTAITGLAYAQAPALYETQMFIQNNLKPSYSGTNYNVSCVAISFDHVFQGKRFYSRFSLRDVEFDEDTGLSGEPKIIFRCISGNCVQDTMLPRSGTNEVSAVTAVASGRVLKALEHMQGLCGGPNATPF